MTRRLTPPRRGRGEPRSSPFGWGVGGTIGTAGRYGVAMLRMQEVVASGNGAAPDPHRTIGSADLEVDGAEPEPNHRHARRSAKSAIGNTGEGRRRGQDGRRRSPAHREGFEDGRAVGLEVCGHQRSAPREGTWRVAGRLPRRREIRTGRMGSGAGGGARSYRGEASADPAARAIDHTHAEVARAAFDARKASLRDEGEAGRWMPPFVHMLFPRWADVMFEASDKRTSRAFFDRSGIAGWPSRRRRFAASPSCSATVSRRALRST